MLALDFIKEFDKYQHQLTDFVQFTPRFVTWGCPACTAQFKQEECFGNGKYCAPNHNKSMDSFVLGRNIIMEDLRQSCLHKQLVWDSQEPLWWDYIKSVHSECFEFISEECSQNAHKAINQDFAKTMACVDASFEPAKPNEEKWQQDNTLLRENAKQWTEYGVLYWPSITINQMTFRGDITPINVVEAVCASLWSQPPFCMDFYIEENIQVP